MPTYWSNLRVHYIRRNKEGIPVESKLRRKLRRAAFPGWIGTLFVLCPISRATQHDHTYVPPQLRDSFFNPYLRAASLRLFIKIEES